MDKINGPLMAIKVLKKPMAVKVPQKPMAIKVPPKIQRPQKVRSPSFSSA